MSVGRNTSKRPTFAVDWWEEGDDVVRAAEIINMVNEAN